MKKITVLAILVISFAIGFLTSGCGKSRQPAEGPEEVVKKFYAYVKEGGPTTLGEAYKLCSTKRYKLHKDIFRDIVSKYSKDMKVNVINSQIMKDRAVVKIECRVPSGFGGDYVQESDVNLDLDEKTNTWKIDFTGETQAQSKEEPGPAVKGEKSR